MSTLSYNEYECVEHHGIKGQKWGKRNGPPYPLDADDHSASEKKARWKKSLDKDRVNPDNDTKSVKNDFKKGLSDKQKKYIKIGAIAVASALATYGAYRISKSDNFKIPIDFGKRKIDNLFVKGIDVKHKYSTDDAIKNANPTKSRSNCYNCVVAVAARLCGHDVTALSDTQNGSGFSFDSLCRVFKKDPDNPSQVRHVYSPSVDKISRIIEKKYSEGDVGAIGIGLKRSRIFGVDQTIAHTLNWVIQNSKCVFLDGQSELNDSFLREYLSKYIDTDTEASVAKFGNVVSGLDAAVEELKDFVRN